jgi:hypothetical protein
VSNSQTADCDRSVYYVVSNGTECTRPVSDDRGLSGPRVRFRNTLKPESLARIRHVVEVAEALSEPMTTEGLIRAAMANSDSKGALGALRMLDVEGVVHATAGPRRQLVWNRGPRPKEVLPPKGARRERYGYLHDFLRHENTRWHATDFLAREAAFDPDLRVGSDDDGRPLHGRKHRELPVNFFRDNGKSARKYVLGALKALYWLELVAWRHHSCQAIEWRWIEPVPERRKARPRKPLPSPPSASQDPYLTDKLVRPRHEALAERALDRFIAYENTHQAWVDTHHPEAAERYRDGRSRRAKEKEARRRAERREAKRWEISAAAKAKASHVPPGEVVPEGAVEDFKEDTKSYK